MSSAMIVGVAGEMLGAEEAAFLRAARPCGVILFARNCRDRDQIRALVADVKAAVGENDILVPIDQEGGRVQRLRPPLGRALPPAAAFGRLYESEPEAASEAAFSVARLVAHDLSLLGINTVCAPVLDVPVPGAHGVIGDRAYGTLPSQISALGRAVAEGLMAGGLLPVIKHIPGHGRATVDSHFALPTVATCRQDLAETDFAPFRTLADMPAAMTAHVVFTAIDKAAPASTSRTVTQEIIRGHMGFDGLLMSDDLSMRALRGSLRERAEAVIAAGSDVALHCNGNLREMEEVAAGVPRLADDALRRFQAAARVFARCEACDLAAAEGALARMMTLHAAAASRA